MLDATRVSLDDEKDESDGGSDDDSPNSESPKSKSEEDAPLPESGVQFNRHLGFRVGFMVGFGDKFRGNFSTR